jgi:hypothetical protein
MSEDTIIGIVGGAIVGLIMTHVYYRLQKRRRELCWSIDSTNLIKGYSSLFEKLEIQYEGQKIENPTVSKIVFWNNGNETIDRTDTFSMSDITSVNVTKRAKSKRSFWLVLWSVTDQTGYFSEFFNIGMVFIVIGLALTLTAKPAYVVQIRSASGESNILSSTDRSFIQKIVNAMKIAIAQRE